MPSLLRDDLLLSNALGRLQPAIFLLSFASWSLLELWVFSRNWRRINGERTDRGTLWIIVGIIYVSVAAAFYAVFALRKARIIGPEPLIFLTGIGLMWAGIGLRLWAICTLRGFFHPAVVLQERHRLICTGPYRWLRNPAYAGSLTTLLGLGLALGNWVALAVLVVAPLLTYVWRIRVEDTALRGRFGEDYVQYARRTWSLIPFVW
jgi:protein-S-isoprenylcysteine O-methyltransferase